MDHPLDYDIVVEGDWYHDPQVPEGEVTWQYAVVPIGFEFPDVRYEVIHECYLPANDPDSKSSNEWVDWEAVEKEAYVLTGNSALISEPHTKAASKVSPSGRITIVDRHANGSKPFGVAGVKVMCNSFVKFSTAYTDRDGYYTMPQQFASDLRYRLVFKNEKGFSIGKPLTIMLKLISQRLQPASYCKNRKLCKLCEAS